MSPAAEVMLTELERDALTEIVNIGVSRAAASLRKMVGAQVLLSVPSLDIITQKAAAVVIGERELDELVAVRQAFSGAFSGRALLIFPQGQSLELVRAVTGGVVSPEELVEIEAEALAETGNVILNGCLASMANMLQRSLDMSIPEVMRGSGAELFTPADGAEAGESPVVLFLYIDFAVREHDIRGYIAMLMDLPSLSALQTLIAEFIERVMADDGGAS
ncbi:chemotaxis protein CheX [Lichenibacterium minor]|uniref:Chemotaxis protein CheX n=1 Tax=Lichenibacterium minor TaxID=2316528 RepID=A0A4Q2U5A3_9HYPH|nr:chemotaxis protein CheX [Lichenibacterium minor]RYC29985.1 chemotaxis protein CheX [Lichenibacterium minor]